ncbi:MAG: TRAP transporter small permease [Phyllobacteriaceae bacterium]|nr:TRAP transporter small permease [Phyllobacteriaceae bacterium]
MSDLATTSDISKDSRLVRLILAFSAILVAAIVIVTFGQVILRYFFNAPQTWAEEVGRYLFVWITLIGASVAVARDNHIRLDSLVTMLPKKAQSPLDIFRRLVELASFGLLLYSGIIVTMRNLTGSFYTLPGVPRWLFYVSVPLGAGLMLLFGLWNLWRCFKRG